MTQVAVITRTKDRELLLDRAMQSVLEQTFSDWIHVIVNDGGDQETVDKATAKYLAKYDGRLKVLHRDKSTGMEAASNAAIASCESQYIVIHDDDDSWAPEFLEKTVTLLEELRAGDAKASYQGIATRAMLLKEEIKDGRVNTISTEFFNPELEVISLAKLAGRNPIPPISFIYSREAYDKLGGYDESLKVAGDWEFNLRFLLEFDIKVLPASLANYHIRPFASGSYQNTVVGEVDKHTEARNLIENRLLRQQIKTGSLGLGELISTQKSLTEITDKLVHLESELLPLAKFLTRVKNLILLKRFRK